jgi:hypothetical protein
LQTFAVNRRYIILLGREKSEIWYNAGNPLFPFAELPGIYFEHGCIAPYSVATEDLSTYFLGSDRQGQGIVFKIQGYQCLRVSSHTVEQAIQNLIDRQVNIADALGYTCQIGGHVFYVLTFREGDQSWALDISTGLWTQWGWSDTNGVLHRLRDNCFAYLYQKCVVGDFENGTIYSLATDSYLDEVPSDTRPFTCVRGFPHVVSGDGPQGPVLAAGKRVEFKQFIVDMECGAGPALGPPLSLLLRWSDDRGKTFGNAILQSGGQPGEFLTQPQWPGTGIARDRVFELSYTYNGPAALNGAWVDAQVLDS